MTVFSHNEVENYFNNGLELHDNSLMEINGVYPDLNNTPNTRIEPAHIYYDMLGYTSTH